MLRRLRIENLVLIQEAELDLSSGLNAITGETGAGKTVLAQAIGLLLGAKGDAAFVGPGAEEAYVEAEFDPPQGLFEEEGLEALAELRPEDEDGLVVARLGEHPTLLAHLPEATFFRRYRDTFAS